MLYSCLKNQTFEFNCRCPECSPYSKWTRYYNHEKEEWTNGPDLNIGRRGHTAGLVTDTINGNTLLFVFGGFEGKTGTYLDSTEVLINGEWIVGNR